MRVWIVAKPVRANWHMDETIEKGKKKISHDTLMIERIGESVRDDALTTRCR